MDLLDTNRFGRRVIPHVQQRLGPAVVVCKGGKDKALTWAVDPTSRILTSNSITRACDNRNPAQMMDTRRRLQMQPRRLQ